jgi:alpha-ketoglutarate-dependent taurine dioxygenase
VHPDPGTVEWHTDLSFQARPALATILFGLEVAREGGETEFCDLEAAWDALPASEQRRLAGLRCVHDLAASRRRSGDTPLTERQRREAPPVEHPLVRTHPETGRKVLYLSSHIDYVIGMSEKESDALLAELVAHATAPPRTIRHRWTAGDVVMWDNRCTMHRAAAYDLAEERRIVQRTVVIGDAPV